VIHPTPERSSKINEKQLTAQAPEVKKVTKTLMKFGNKTAA
jgi:hypothetical protein